MHLKLIYKYITFAPKIYDFYHRSYQAFKYIKIIIKKMEKEKYYVFTTGKEVGIGDVLHMKSKVAFKNESIEKVLTYTLTKENIKNFVEKGILSKEDPMEEMAPIFAHYVHSLAKYLDITPKVALDFIEDLFIAYPILAFSIMLRVISIECDDAYKDSISDAEEIWGVSALNGKPYKLSKQEILSYDNFAAFRSELDAEYACFVLRFLLVDMFE